RVGDVVKRNGRTARRTTPRGPTLAVLVAQWQQSVGNKGVEQLTTVGADATDRARSGDGGDQAEAAEHEVAPAAARPSAAAPPGDDDSGVAPEPASASTPKSLGATGPGVLEIEPLEITGRPPAKDGGAEPGVIEMEPMDLRRPATRGTAGPG